jgi:alanine-alpha-ketoisovalerate/valine-pyruvate aminotransferase
MERGLLAAVRRFPLQGQEITRLAFADDSFRSLCNDLADAEAARDRLANAPSPQGAARLIEYETLVNELASEVEERLRHRTEIV